MMFKKIITPLALALAAVVTAANGQHTTNYNLANLLKEGKLDTVDAHHTIVSDSAKNGAITTNGFVWLTGVNFKGVR